MNGIFFRKEWNEYTKRERTSGKRHPLLRERHAEEENLWFVVRHPMVREG